MSSRLLFVLVAAFWLTMNLLLWRLEYGSHGSGVAVPLQLVWRKILTAPDPSSMNIFKNGERTGFCEFSTSVVTEMAKLDEKNLPPEGLPTRTGYQIHINGNTSLEDFTNRLRFDARIQFSAKREWRELTLKVSSRAGSVELHSLATNQSVHLKITTEDSIIENDLAFDELRNPNALLRAFIGNIGGGFFNALELPILPMTAVPATQDIQWQAHRARLRLRHEPVSTYRLDTRVLAHPVVIYVSTLGEILRVELPGGFTATLDEWNKP